MAQIVQISTSFLLRAKSQTRKQTNLHFATAALTSTPNVNRISSTSLKKKKLTRIHWWSSPHSISVCWIFCRIIISRFPSIHSQNFPPIQSLWASDCAVRKRTIAKDCAHHFLIATSKLLQDQIQAASSQKLHSPDTERETETEIGKSEREKTEREKKVSRHDKRRRAAPWRLIVSAALKGHLMLSKDHLQSPTRLFFTLLPTAGVKRLSIKTFITCSYNKAAFLFPV